MKETLPRLSPWRGGPSIAWRLTLALAGVSILTLLVVGLVFYGFLGHFVVQRQEQQILTRVTQVADQLPALAEGAAPTGATATKALNTLLASQLRGLPDAAGIVVFRGGAVAAKAGSIPQRAAGIALLHAEARRLSATEPSFAVITRVLDAQPQNRVIVAAARASVSGPATFVAAILPTSSAFAERLALGRLLLIAGAIAIVVAVLLGYGLGSLLSRPVRRLSALARGMAGGSYEQPVSGSYPGEFQELAASMETMREEVKHSDESLRSFVGSAAHELRTPLTSIQGFSQALLDGTATTADEQQRSAAAIYRESARLKRLVDALLMLSRYDSREFRPTYATVDAAAIVREEIERLVQADLAQPERVVLRANPAVPATTDPDMFRQVVANLLRNAVQYGGEDVVEVRLASDQMGLSLEVRSGGVPLSPEERQRMFDRFYRGTRARQADGLGLGLSLVREICQMLGGNVALVGSGPETVFRVLLPRAPAAAPVS